MTEEESAAAQPFIKAYDQVRQDEKWGEDDLDLPFHPRRHHEIWAIRQRTFLSWKEFILLNQIDVYRVLRTGRAP